jgi:POT family proton-dependent oligopeptide transporter
MSLPTTQRPQGSFEEIPKATVAVPDTHPPALWFFFWGEFAERCSYYGMRAILFLYLTRVLSFADNDATVIQSSFKMTCYFLPLVGGFLADRFFGRYWTIVGFSIPYVMGHFILPLPSMFGIPTEVFLFMGLALLAGGSGVIKPNISTLMGQTYDQKRPGKILLRTAAFQWFYLSINVGAVISQFCLPKIRDHFGPRTAFQFPAWLMVGALIIFALGKRFYGEDVKAQELTPEERAEQWRVFRRLLGLFAVIVFFWAPYEQNDNLWIAFIRDYVDPTIRLGGWSYELSSDQIQFLNPLFVIILIPTFVLLFRLVDPNTRIFTPMTKIVLGFLFTALASGTMSAAGFRTQSTESHVVVYWPMAAYIILTVGEVLLYGTMLELAYVAAPKSMKGFVTACFLVTDALGNFVNMGLALLYRSTPTSDRGALLPGQFFFMSSMIALVAGVAFIYVGRQFSRAQEAHEPGPLSAADPGATEGA